MSGLTGRFGRPTSPSSHRERKSLHAFGGTANVLGLRHDGAQQSDQSWKTRVERATGCWPLSVL